MNIPINKISRRIIAISVASGLFLSSQAHTADTPSDSVRSVVSMENPYRFKPTQLIVPAAFIGIGAIGVSNGWLKSVNEEVREGLTKSNHDRLRIDDVSLILPTATVYVLDLCGVKGKTPSPTRQSYSALHLY